MELKGYWTVIRGRLWLVILLTLAAFLFGAVYSPRSLASYRASVRLAVKPESAPRLAPYYTYDEYYAYVASEYLNDDIGKIVEGGAFMAELRTRAARETGRTPSGSLEVRKAHRLLMIDASANNPDDALLIAQQAAIMLMDTESPYFSTISDQNPRVTLMDPPAIASSTPASRVGVDIAMRTLLGFLAGVALAFILDYLEDTVRRRADVEDLLGLTVLGEIPPERGSR